MTTFAHNRATITVNPNCCPRTRCGWRVVREASATIIIDGAKYVAPIERAPTGRAWRARVELDGHAIEAEGRRQVDAAAALADAIAETMHAPAAAAQHHA